MTPRRAAGRRVEAVPMRGQGEPTGEGPLWASGDMMFRVAGAGAEPDRLVKVERPFAVVGRARGVDIPVDRRDASARHVYLHLDRRGVYAVDLVTRTGTRIKGADQAVGWLRPGDWLEVAGLRVELVRVRLGGAAADPPPTDDDLLADTDRPGLPGVTLEPHRGDEPPWVLGSELVFLGWSAACGIQVKDQAVARTHCALVRAPAGAFLVDLCGRQTWVEDRPVAGASALRDGDLITLGSTRFTVRVEPPAAPAASGPIVHVPEVLPRHEADAPALPPLPFGTELVPAEAQTALLAWVVGAIRGGQGEVLRRQGEYHQAMSQALRQVQQDNAALLRTLLDHIERNNQELAALRAEIERRDAGPPGRVPPPPAVEPLRIARPAPAPRDAAPSGASTAWLLERVNQLEEENRSAWKDLFGRISPSRKSP
jgi:hypothetical protein